jgi:hypothetical protein
VDPNDPFQFIKGLMPPTDIAQIRALVDQVYGPQRDLINQQIAETAGQAKARADQMSQVYQDFAKYMTNLPDTIKGIYADAGKQGFQAGQALMSGPQGNVGAKLGQFSDINQGLLNAESANWQSYAAAQPGIYSLRATDAVKQMLGVAGANEQTLRNSLLTLSSQEASSILSYLQSAQAKDAQLQEWAYGQHQSQANAQLLADQRDAQLKFNAWQVSLAHGDRVQTERDRVAWQATQAKLRQDQLGISQQNANTSATRANNSQFNADRNYKLAQQRYQLSQRKYLSTKADKTATVQVKLAGVKKAAADYARSLKAASAGSVSVPTWVDPTGTQTSPVAKKGWTRTTSSSPTSRYTKAQVFNLVYKAYASDLFVYYGRIYPGYSRGQLQGWVNRSIRAVV